MWCACECRCACHRTTLRSFVSRLVGVSCHCPDPWERLLSLPRPPVRVGITPVCCRVCLICGFWAQTGGVGLVQPVLLSLESCQPRPLLPTPSAQSVVSSRDYQVVFSALGPHALSVRLLGRTCLCGTLADHKHPASSPGCRHEMLIFSV